MVLTSRDKRSELNCAFCSLRKEENSINNTTHNTWRRSSISFSHHLFWLTNRCVSGADLGGGCRGCAPPPPRLPEMTCGFLIQLVFCKQKKTMWFIGVEVEQETRAPPPKKNPGSAPAVSQLFGVFRHDCFPPKRK